MRPVLPTNVHSHQEEAARDRSLLLHQGWREGEAGKRSDGAERGGEMKGTGVERTGQGRDEER